MRTNQGRSLQAEEGGHHCEDRSSSDNNRSNNREPLLKFGIYEVAHVLLIARELDQINEYGGKGDGIQDLASHGDLKEIDTRKQCDEKCDNELKSEYSIELLALLVARVEASGITKKF